MKNYRHIILSQEQHVLMVALNRPPSNFFDQHMIGEIADAFTDADQNPDCRALVLAAEGKHFCAGADLGGEDQRESEGSERWAEKFADNAAELYRHAARLFAIRKPIVGAIEGAAIGGGLGLALVPDFRVACPEARFSANFVKLGIHQGFGLSVTMPRLIGSQAAQAMLLTGRRIGGDEALKLGLVDQLTNLASVRGEALLMAKEIAANAPLAVQSVRATLRRGLAEAVANATEHELKEQEWLRTTEDAAEGILAVAERRVGQFKGR